MWGPVAVAVAVIGLALVVKSWLSVGFVRAGGMMNRRRSGQSRGARDADELPSYASATPSYSRASLMSGAYPANWVSISFGAPLLCTVGLELKENHNSLRKSTRMRTAHMPHFYTPQTLTVLPSSIL